MKLLPICAHSRKKKKKKEKKNIKKRTVACPKQLATGNQSKTSRTQAAKIEAYIFIYICI